MINQKRILAIVSGRVQGVMYRDFAARTAKKLSVVGEVENQKDGTVKVVAQGEEKNLAVFQKKLWRGSLFSKVSNVSVKDLQSGEEYPDFRIIYYGQNS